MQHFYKTMEDIIHSISKSLASGIVVVLGVAWNVVATATLLIMQAFQEYILTQAVTDQLRKIAYETLSSTTTIILVTGFLVALIAGGLTYKLGPKFFWWTCSWIAYVVMSIVTFIAGFARVLISLGIMIVVYGLLMRFAMTRYVVIDNLLN